MEIFNTASLIPNKYALKNNLSDFPQDSTVIALLNENTNLFVLNIRGIFEIGCNKSKFI